MKQITHQLISDGNDNLVVFIKKETPHTLLASFIGFMIGVISLSVGAYIYMSANSII